MSDNLTLLCAICNSSNVNWSAVPKTGVVRGETVTVTVNALKCVDCGHAGVRGDQLAEFSKAVADAYRVKKNLLTSEDIQRTRRVLGMTWKEFADHVCIGEATLKRWMAGEIQSGALDKLVRLSTDLGSIERQLDVVLARSARKGKAVDNELDDRVLREKRGRRLSNTLVESFAVAAVPAA